MNANHHPSRPLVAQGLIFGALPFNQGKIWASPTSRPSPGQIMFISQRTFLVKVTDAPRASSDLAGHGQVDTSGASIYWCGSICCLGFVTFMVSLKGEFWQINVWMRALVFSWQHPVADRKILMPAPCEKTWQVFVSNSLISHTCLSKLAPCLLFQSGCHL